MAKPQPPSPNGPFDLDQLRKLLQMMERHGATEINLESENERWKVRRGPKEVHVAPAAAAAPAPVAAAQVVAPAAAAPAAPTEAPAAEAPGVTINSPTVGTFYSAPTPDDPDFVKVGDKVSGETIVCIVEAMKVFNQIPAEVSGKILEVLVKSGDPIEFGQPMFRVEA